MKDKIIELYHIARVSVGNGRHDRMLYCQRELRKIYPLMSPKKIWLEIEAAIS